MSRFSLHGHGSTPFPKGKAGKQLTLQTMHNNQYAHLEALTKARLGQAIQLLLNADRLMRAYRNPAEAGNFRTLINGYARTYFRLQQDDIPDELAGYIQIVITKVLNGLTGDVSIKIGDNVGKAGNGPVHGIITAKPLENVQGAPKPHQNDVENFITLNGKRYGAIRLERKSFERRNMGIVVLIHEATHKYAGTIDYGYFDENGQPRLPDLQGGQFDEELAIYQNADSYAYFIFHVGRLGSGRLGD